MKNSKRILGLEVQVTSLQATVVALGGTVRHLQEAVLGLAGGASDVAFDVQERRGWMELARAGMVREEGKGKAMDPEGSLEGSEESYVPG